MALPVRARAGERSLAIYHAIGTVAESFEQASRRLFRLAEIAYGARDYAALKEITAALSAIPYQPAERAARYYQAILIKRAGDLDRAADLLATIQAPRALHTLGTIEECRGNWTEAARLHVEAMRAARGLDVFTVTSARLQLAAIRAVDGDHAGALADFQSMWPTLRTAARAHPHLYPLWCNALAVELGELGRIEEARQAAAIAIASPVADRYPEWLETAEDLHQAEQAGAIVVVKSRQEVKSYKRTAFYKNRSLLTADQRSAVSVPRRAFGSPWCGLLERVKACARDRDGPFANRK